MDAVEATLVVDGSFEVHRVPAAVGGAQGHVVVAAADLLVDEVALGVPAGGAGVGGGDGAVDDRLVLGVPAELEVGGETLRNEIGEILRQGHRGLGDVVLDGAVTGVVQQVPGVVALLRDGQRAVGVLRHDADRGGGEGARIDGIAVAGRGVGVGELVRQAQTEGGGLGDVDVHVGAEAELVEAHAGVVAVVVGVEDTLLIVVVAAHVVTDVLRTAADAEVGAARGGALLEDGVDPVHGGVEVRVGAAEVEALLVVGDGRHAAEVGVEAVVVVHPLLRAGELRQAGRPDETGLGLEGDLRLGLGTALGGDEDDTIGTTHTVEGRRGCILEDGEGGDVLGVDKVHVAFHAVDEHQRLAVGAEGVHTADPEVGACARLTGLLHDDDTGQFTGQGGGELADGHLELFHVDRGDGTDDGGFALGTVGDHDDLLQHVGLGHELDADVGLVAYLDFLVGVADEAGDEDVAGLHVDREAAVRVGHRAAGLALDGHAGAGERLAGLIQHRTLNLAALRQDGKACRQDEDHRQREGFQMGRKLHILLVISYFSSFSYPSRRQVLWTRMGSLPRFSMTYFPMEAGTQAISMKSRSK